MLKGVNEDEALVKDSIGQLDEQLIHRSCELCVTTAHCLIETIHEHLGGTHTGSSWHSVYCEFHVTKGTVQRSHNANKPGTVTFASATILLASTRLPKNHGDNQTHMLEVSWTRCFAILKFYERQIKSAPRAAEVLRTLLRQTKRRSQLVSGELSFRSRRSSLLRIDCITGTSSSGSLSESRTNPLFASTMPTNNDFGGAQTPTHTERTEPSDPTYPFPQQGETSFETWFGQHLADFDSIFQAG